MTDSKEPVKETFGPWSKIIFPAPATFLIAGLWLWACWSCAEHWRGNPNYSYGWIVPALVFGFAWRRWWNITEISRPNESSATAPSFPFSFGVALICGAAICAIEFAREEVWHPQIILWSICGLAIVATYTAIFCAGGRRLARAEIFPLLFFLTAVPWPPRIEQPITSHLMRWVAVATTELLHWLGIEAQTSGAAIALHSGLVGITEACSGIRSLQAGIMFGLAMGEWFLLRPVRRVVLLGLAVLLALGTNLARTLALSLQAEWHGIASVDRVHDLIGTIVITAMVIGIWFAGKLLQSRDEPLVRPQSLQTKLQDLMTALPARTNRFLRLTTVCCLLGFFLARIVAAHLDAQDHSQLVPFFTTRSSAKIHLLEIPHEIWTELHPTSGEFIREENPDLPAGVADCFHFFWKPSPWNRFALVHRPDICMPGVGWKLTEPPQTLEIDFNGNKLRCYAFSFQRENLFALELWGVWRNGEPVSLDYQPAQILGDALPPPSLQLEGKRRSATEIIACSLVREDEPPSREIAVAVLQSVFEYERK